jgi:O-antigen ligase
MIVRDWTPTFWIGFTEALFLLGWIAGGRHRDKLRVMWSNPVARISLLLALLAMAGMIWSPADGHAAFKNLGKYRELLLIPLMISLMDDARWARRTLYGFIAGLSFVLIWSYLVWFGLVPPYDDGAPYSGFTGHISYSTMLAFLVAASFWFAWFNKTWRWAWVVLGVLALINLFLINTGRTGQVILFALIPLMLFRCLRWRGLLLAGGLIAVLASGFYAISPTFKSRIQAAVSDIHQYQAGNPDTSWGLRLEFWKNTMQLIREHPLVGGGTGSFAYEYELLAKAQGLTGDRITPNPHHEYLLIWSQWGLIGLLMFIGLFWTQWKMAIHLPETDRNLGETLVVVMAIGCLFNSFLLDNREGHFYTLMSVALWSQLPVQRQRHVLSHAIRHSDHPQ